MSDKGNDPTNGSGRHKATARDENASASDENFDADSRFSPQDYVRSIKELTRENNALLRSRFALEEKIGFLEDALAKITEPEKSDELTGLASRRLLQERFDQSSALNKRQGQKMALLFLEVEDIGVISDKHGAAVGDDLLKKVAQRLFSSVRASDTASRYGGSDFVVLLTQIKSRECAITAVQRIRDVLQKPCKSGDLSIRLKVSYGLAVYPEDGQSYSDLMRQSNFSKYRSKAERPNSSSDSITSRTWK